MASKRFFFTGPARLIADTRLTGLDHRCLAVIAMHDGMSKVTGKGAGCFAKNATLAAMVGTDVSNFSKCLSRLIAWGYVAREPQLMDKRRFTLRVVYGDDDSWRTDQQSPAEIVGEQANPAPEIVGDGESGNGGFSKENGSHYISLNEELDFVETKEINSSEEAHLAGASHFKVDDPDAIHRNGRANPIAKKDGAKALVSQWALQPHLPRNFTSLPPAARLCRFEEAFKQIGRDPERMNSRERDLFAQWLYETAEEFITDTAICNHAQRLWEEVAVF